MSGTDPCTDPPFGLPAEPEGAFEPERLLDLADPNERLPWLESDDDDDERPGVDTGRIVGFGVVALLAIAAFFGGLWWATHQPPDEVEVADGGLIEAPAGPYKVKPASPGGRQVAGTGDTSFAVAEGQGIEGRIADPAGAATPKPSPKPSAGATGSPAPPTPGAIGVQVGAYLSPAQAEAGWTQLSSRLDPLKGRNHRVVEGQADSGTVFRLQAVTGSVAEAEALCRSIKAAGGDCQVKR